MMRNDSYPNRKQIRLPNYNYNQNGTYYVTFCTQDRKLILSSITNEYPHIKLLPCGRVVEKYIRNTPEITKYVIMPDHVHMIIEIQNGTAWESKGTDGARNIVANIVRSVKTLVTKEMGYAIFQRSYHDHVIRNQQDYDETWEYIDNNPYKWVLQKRGFE